MMPKTMTNRKLQNGVKRTRARRSMGRSPATDLFSTGGPCYWPVLYRRVLLLICSLREGPATDLFFTGVREGPATDLFFTGGSCYWPVLYGRSCYWPVPMREWSGGSLRSCTDLFSRRPGRSLRACGARLTRLARCARFAGSALNAADSRQAGGSRRTGGTHQARLAFLTLPDAAQLGQAGLG